MINMIAERGTIVLLCVHYQVLHGELEQHIDKLERVPPAEREKHLRVTHEARDFLARFGEIIMEHAGESREHE